jgi:hypothetical protein
MIIIHSKNLIAPVIVEEFDVEKLTRMHTIEEVF